MTKIKSTPKKATPKTTPKKYDPTAPREYSGSPQDFVNGTQKVKSSKSPVNKPSSTITPVNPIQKSFV